MPRRRTFVVLASIATPILLYGILLGTIAGSSQPLNHPLAHWPIFPLACTTRGCITSAGWLTQHQITLAFNEATAQSNPTPEQTLTTTIRKHLVEHAFLRSPVSDTDVDRYRRDILHAVSDESIQNYVHVSIADYDDLVVRPFLQQEALRFQHKVESTEELYKILTSERPVLFLLFAYRWDPDSGSAAAR